MAASNTLSSIASVFGSGASPQEGEPAEHAAVLRDGLDR